MHSKCPVVLLFLIGMWSSQVGCLAARRFNFSCALFRHEGKTGGTTIAAVLSVLVGSRDQKLELCYGHGFTCDGSSKFQAGFPNRVSDFPLDRCRKNQIVYGHGITAGFAEYWHLPDTSLLWIAMFREPLEWVKSKYKQRVTHNTRGFNMTFDTCVQSGRCYFHYYKRTLPYPINERREGDQVDILERWMRQPNVLVLVTEYFDASIHKLATFLGASTSEESNMIAAAREPKNVKPSNEHDMYLSEQSLQSLMKGLRLDYIAYDIALHVGGSGKTDGRGLASKGADDRGGAKDKIMEARNGSEQNGEE